MSYREAIEILSAMTQELQTKPGQPRRKFSLDEFRALLVELGDPQKKFRSVLIGGTNGKGSTASTLASILGSSGVRVGLYTSPHLERVNERIRISGTEISNDDFGDLFFRVQEVAERMVREGKLPQKPSFFEVLTALAMIYFSENEVGLAVLEVGMGGRLDATNVVDPLISIITDISLDHTEWLGSTISAITREKAGILRKGGTLITLPQDLEANRTLEEISSELGVKVVDASKFLPVGVQKKEGLYQVEAMGSVLEVASPLQGVHQHRNVALAIAASVELESNHGFKITSSTIENGIRRTCWPGRLEHIKCGGVEWILDVAHNKAGAEALRSGLAELLLGIEPKILIFSCLKDKPLNDMARILFPIFDKVIFAPIHSARATSVEDLKAAGRELGVLAEGVESVGEALQLARESVKNGVVVISGSVYLVGEARSLLIGGENG
jgi:dihydrofolate synthase/folylpolyglutamate synthase